MRNRRLNSVLRLLFHAPVVLYRWRCGWVFGNRFLLLIHVGRRTGLRRRTMLEVIEYRPDCPEAVVMSAFGPKADWLLNIKAGTGAEIIIGSRRFAAVWRFLGEDEAANAVIGYQARNWVVAPIIRFALSRFAGWRYDGSDEHARRLVAQLPVVGFRPARTTRAESMP